VQGTDLGLQCGTLLLPGPVCVCTCVCVCACVGVVCKALIWACNLVRSSSQDLCERVYMCLCVRACVGVHACVCCVCMGGCKGERASFLFTDTHTHTHTHVDSQTHTTRLPLPIFCADLATMPNNSAALSSVLPYPVCCPIQCAAQQ
jgi:hypothetical protein